MGKKMKEDNEENFKTQKLYSALTSCVDKCEIETNFFKGLGFKNNFMKCCQFLEDLMEEYEGIEVISGFDYQSKDNDVNTFRSITIAGNKELFEDILENYANSKDVEYYIIDITSDKKYKDITITFSE